MFDGRKLMALIAYNGLTQESFSILIRVSPTTINKIIKGRRQPNLHTLSKICEYFNVSASVLMGKKELVLK